MQRITAGGDGATGEASVARIDDEATAGVGERVERAAQAVELSGRTPRRTQVSAAESDTAAAVERETLDGCRLLEEAGGGGDEIGGRRGTESQALGLGAARGRGAQGHGVAGDGADDRVGGRPGAGDGHPREEAGGVRDRDGRRVVHGGGEDRPGAHGRGQQAAILGGGQKAEAVGIVGDEAADGVAAVDADDVGADAIRDRAGRRGIGTGQVRRRGDDVDAVGAGGTSAQRARGAGVQRQRPMQRAALSVERTDVDARLVAGVLREVPDRLAGDVLGRGERLDDGRGRRTGEIEHAAAVIEDAVIRGLNGTGAPEAVAEGVRAIEREHAAET